ncbi:MULTISPECIES: molecular chaperone DnaJ [Xanthobacter]|uniref:Chaperone protein DnaJ n=2 Tax=Xanthobacter TaxID=279 RepID=A0A9W6CFE7_XANFL|nr:MULTISPECIES: molecular chaperone DnaJ [Xanthobacter]MCL8384527.1 molecular chaperone DnaJ [Xanthobacter aminoxidans]MDR6332736.1 molecular chaperone DnaJ [Xanthobacter flavus]UDQ89753.1 molecular chaperone DnaJ [Xanthobacter autotrophicus]GLI21011.1 chaperone protein DnaJ [Xanthobacter flavus]
MAKRDYYETLGCDRGADETVLKASYRKLAMKWHPDRNQGDAEAEVMFKEVNEAYEVLKDPQKRAAYDRFGHAAFENGGGGPGFGNDFASSFADIFDDLFGGAMGRGRGGGGGQQRGRGSDLRYNMEITLEEAFVGKTAQIKIPTSVACEACNGTGAKPGTQPKACRTCGGAGKIRHAQGFFTLERTCPTCQGRGSVIEDPCGACAGAGRVTRERTLSVQIPPGVEDGTRIRLGGEGEAGVRGGPAGDLYIFLSIEQHAFFQREGADLYCRVPISMVTAALGGAVEVPTIDGDKTKVKIPEGTQSQKRFRLSGKGMPILRSRSAGDMYVQVVVETPQKLTKRQRELLAEFDKESSGETHPESAGFFAKVKEFFQGAAGEGA